MASPILIPGNGFPVGSITTELVDHDRPRSLVHDETGRKLFIKIWYPCVKQTSNQDYEKYWGQLLNESNLPLLMRWIASRANRYETTSRSNAKLSPKSWHGSIVIYNHGLIGFASENTTLAEYLVSRGNIVIAVQHIDQLEEYKVLESNISKDDKKRSKSLARTMQSAIAEERKEAAALFSKFATNTNAIATERAMDSRYVVACLDSLLMNIPGLITDSGPDISISAVGLSLGGAVSIELAKSEPTVQYVVNIDGGIYGESRNLPLSNPCLMVYSEANKNINELTLNPICSEVESVTINGTKHVNFHDIALIFPRLLKMLGVLGKLDVASAIHKRNELVETFISKNLLSS